MAKTLQEYLDKCEEFGGCMFWNGYYQQGVPFMKGENKSRPVRRVFTELIHGEAKAFAYVPSCGNRRCVAPDHIVALGKKDYFRDIGKKASEGQSKHIRITKMTATKRAESKITAEMRILIVNSNARSDDQAAELGISKSVVNKIRRHAKTMQASPWAGLLKG